MTSKITNREQSSTTPGAHHGELITGTVETDSNGDGELAVSFRNGYAEQPALILDDTSDPVATISDASHKRCTISVSGSNTTDGAVTVTLLVTGPKGQRP